MAKNIMFYSWYLTKFSFVFTMIAIYSHSPSFALGPSDPKKICEMYGCENGIPITPPQPGPVSRPEEPGRPRPRPVAVRFCAFYEDANFRGARGWLQLGTAYDYVGGGWNDRISSISCSPGCRLVAYEHRGYQGATRDFVGSTPFVGVDWNDRISAIRIRCQ